MRTDKTWWASAVMLASMVAGGLALAHVADEDDTTVLQQQKLADMPGKQGVIALVSYAPGAASAPHRHAGSVFAYVLEGEVTSQLEGRPPITYSAGQSWYEPLGFMTMQAVQRSGWRAPAEARRHHGGVGIDAVS